MRVDIFKRKKDGELAYRDECQGLDITSSSCDGEVSYTEKHAYSFGYPFITHAYLCTAHAAKFGYVESK